MRIQYKKLFVIVKLIIKYGFSILLAIIMLAPFAWAVSTAFKPADEIIAFPPQWIPEHPVNNFPEVFRRAPFGIYFLNSIFVALCVVVGVLITSSMGGYAFAKFDFLGKEILFILVLSTMMVPWAVTIIPVYTLIFKLRWLDTRQALIIPPLASAFGIFLFRQFMLGIPTDYIDSARIDGASEFRIYLNIILPLCRPVLATLALFTFMGQWDSLLWPLLVIKSPQKLTIPLGLAQFRFAIYGFNETNLLMAAALISILPTVILFLITQKYFIQGITLTGLKG